MLQLTPRQLSDIRTTLGAKVYLTNANGLAYQLAGFLDVDDNYIRFALFDTRGNLLIGKVAFLKDASVDDQLALIGAE
jgi:hypothetical protein